MKPKVGMAGIGSKTRMNFQHVRLLGDTALAGLAPAITG
jgi:hypothetical protein